jgi:DNA-binding NarL/FixJ family response regulator
MPVTTAFADGPVTVRPKPDRRGRVETRRTPHILLVGDHPAVRQGLALLLEAAGAGACSGAGGRAEALDFVGHRSPDLVILDRSLKDEAFALLAELRVRRVPVLVVSPREDPSHVRCALAAGARGCITDNDVPGGIVRAVRAILDGWILVSPGAAEGLDEE